ncbi:aldo/keto reductase [Chondrinema litorale]|uniref:aldo/keto reductase n=1 Tax=Chondrinema litorale TaxID=2994555 RepID=UPI002542BDDB|nr:aldo/keto reductase [Chondrinema litorale]UZR92428.1 aldo/keto reductase [Chondrinema litorale]
MQYNQLGKSDLKVSEISFGCMSLDGKHTENARLLHEAFDKGINFFDTADLYQFGENEISVGKAFQDKRDEVIIATKVGNQWKEDKSGWSWNPTKKYILEQVEHSLKRLQTDYIDLYQLHGGTLEDPIDETIDAFEILKKEGKIRAYGISSIRPNVIRTYIEKSNIDSVMMQYSLLDRRPEEESLSLLHQNNISVITRGSLAKGLLAGKVADHYLDYSVADVSKMAELVGAVAKENVSAANVAIKYVLQNPTVASAVCGIRTENQLEDVAATATVAGLDSDIYEHLQNVLPVNYYKVHR